MTTLTLQPGLRPAPLPPTLQPHAVLSIAPPTDRMRSAAAAAAIYAMLGFGGVWLSHLGAAGVRPLPIPIGTVTISYPSTPLPPSPAVSSPTHAANPVTPAIPVPKVNASLDASPLMPVQPSQTAPTPAPPDAVSGPLGAPLSISGSTVQILHQVNPIYPPLAKASHLEGQVVIRMTIDERGIPTQVDALSGSAVFTGPALQAAQQWRFAPALQNGEPVPATFLLTLNFVLK